MNMPLEYGNVPSSKEYPQRIEFNFMGTMYPVCNWDVRKMWK